MQQKLESVTLTDTSTKKMSSLTSVFSFIVFRIFFIIGNINTKKVEIEAFLLLCHFRPPSKNTF